MTATQSGFEVNVDEVDALFADRKVNGVLLDRTGTIVYVNAGWKAFARESNLGLPNFGIGQNYLRYCAFADEQSARIIEGITQLLAGRLDCLSYVYPCHSPTEQHWFVLLGFSRVKGDLTALIHLNITGLMPKSESVEPAIVTDRTVAHTPPSEFDHRLETIGSNGRLPKITSTSALPYQARGPSPSPMLSKRQQQVLELMAKGMSNVEIGRVLAISPNTVKIHVSGILARLGLPSRAQAIHWTLTRHLADHPRAHDA